MRDPIVGNSKIRKACKRLADISDYWFVKHIILPVTILMPAALATYVVTEQGLQQWIVDVLGQKVGDLINDSAFLILVGAYVYVALVRGFISALRHYSKPEKELSRNNVIAILKALNMIVSEKQKRMAGKAKECLASDKVDAGDIFRSITQPGQQIVALTEAIKTVFEHIDICNASYKVGLIKVVDSKPTEWIAFAPQQSVPIIEAEELADTTSTVSKSIKKSSIIVVQDVQEELRKNKSERRFYQRDNDFTESGSQLCYPIKHPATKKIEYIISVAGSESKCLLEKHASLYEWIIENFALRILMEHSLLIMREATNGDT